MFYRDIGKKFDFSTFDEKAMNNVISQQEMDQFSEELDDQTWLMIS